MIRKNHKQRKREPQNGLRKNAEANDERTQFLNYIAQQGKGKERLKEKYKKEKERKERERLLQEQGLPITTEQPKVDDDGLLIPKTNPQPIGRRKRGTVTARTLQQESIVNKNESQAIDITSIPNVPAVSYVMPESYSPTPIITHTHESDESNESHELNESHHESDE